MLPQNLTQVNRELGESIGRSRQNLNQDGGNSQFHEEPVTR
jgi:hypothetical protein